MKHPDVLDLRDGAPVALLEQPVEDQRAWTGATLTAKNWTVPIDDAAMAEINAFLEIIRTRPLPILMLSADQFQLEACGKMMGRLRSLIADELGVAVLDRLPLDELTVDEAKAVYWVLGQFIATEVAQKWDGTMLYDVTNTGVSFGYGVRRSWTDLELFFHTDNAFAVAPPDYVSLLCLHPAREGGISRFCSLYTVHNRMLERHPRLLKRLYEPFYFDRQAEHAPQDPKIALTPAFRYDGRRLKARLSANLIRRGYELLGEALDAEGEEALQALEEIMSDPGLWIEFLIERGQMQYLNNWEYAHFRSKFEDDPDRKRHLIRLWYRETGRRFYDG